MKRNKHDERRQEVRHLQKRHSEIWEIRWHDCWVELEEPEPHGWYIRMVLRDDISRREDADVFWEIRDLLEERCWDKEKRMGYKVNNPFMSWSLTGQRNWVDHIPWRKYNHKNGRGYGIDFKVWEKLEPKIKKHFSKPDYIGIWGGGWCICTLPEYYWDRKFERCYATHYQEVDAELESEGDWIDNRLEGNFYDDNNYSYGNKSKGKYVNTRNRRLRQRNKRAIKKMDDFYYEEDSAEFDPFIKDAGWY